MIPEPTSHYIDPIAGTLSNPVGQYTKMLQDLTGLYADEVAFADAVASDGEKIVYNVSDVRPASSSGDLIFGVTHMEPGKIGDEYYMTRGHVHAVANRPETYYGESGEGVMLLESPEGETRTLEIKPRVMVYVPPYWIHRSVNAGATALIMSFCYPADSGQDYQVIADTNGMATRIVADGTGWKAIPNAAYRPRTEAQCKAIFNTAV